MKRKSRNYDAGEIFAQNMTRNEKMTNSLLKQGIAAARQGNKQEAIKYFKHVLSADPNNASAWLWLAYVLDDPYKQVECLQRVLRIDPNNQTAQKALQNLQQRVNRTPDMSSASKNTLHNIPTRPFEGLRHPVQKKNARPWRSPKTAIMVFLVVSIFGLLSMTGLFFILNNNQGQSPLGQDPFQPDASVTFSPIDVTQANIKVSRSAIGPENVDQVLQLGEIGLGAPITAISIADEIKQIAVGYEDGLVRIFDVEKGIPIWQYQNQLGSRVASLALNSSGTRLAVGYDDESDLGGDTILWDLTAGGAYIPLDFDFRGWFSPRGDIYLTRARRSLPYVGPPGPIAFVWNTADGNFSHVITGGPTVDTFVTAFYRDGSVLICEGNDNFLYFFDPYSGTEFFSIENDLPIEKIVVSSDNRYVAGFTGYLTEETSDAAVWSIPDRKLLWHFSGISEFQDIRFVGANNFVETKSSNGERRLWRLADGMQVANTPEFSPHPSVSPDGSFYALFKKMRDSQETPLAIYDANSDKPLNEMHGFDIERSDYAAPYGYSPDGRYLYFYGRRVGENKPKIFLADLNTLSVVAETAPWSGIEKLAIEVTPDGKYIVASFLETIYVFDAKTLTPVHPPENLEEQDVWYDEFIGLEISRDSTKAILHYLDGVIIWDLKNQSLLYRAGGWKLPYERMYSEDFSFYIDPIYSNIINNPGEHYEIYSYMLKAQDGRNLNWTGNWGGSGKGMIFEVGDQSLSSVYNYVPEVSEPQQICNLSTAQWQMSINLYETRPVLRNSPKVENRYYCSASNLSPDKTMIASWDGASLIEVTRLSDNQVIQTFLATDAVKTFGFSSGNELLGISYKEGGLEIYNLMNGDQVLQLDGLAWDVTALVFSKDLGLIVLADGRYLDLIPISNPGNSKYIELESSAQFLDVRFMMNDSLLVTTGDDGVLRLWGIP